MNVIFAVCFIILLVPLCCKAEQEHNYKNITELKEFLLNNPKSVYNRDVRPVKDPEAPAVWVGMTMGIRHIEQVVSSSTM